MDRLHKTMSHAGESSAAAGGAAASTSDSAPAPRSAAASSGSPAGARSPAAVCDRKADMLPPVSEIREKGEGVCPVDWALRVVETARGESCGKCVMCREGLIQLSRLLNDAVTGKGEGDEDIALITDIAGVVGKTATCEMARTAAELVIASVQAWPEEWESHIKRKRCAALVCREYYTVHILPGRCQGTGACLSICPESAIAGGPGLIHVVSREACTRCGLCLDVCPNGAVVKAGAVAPRTPDTPVPVGSFAETTRRRRRGGGGTDGGGADGDTAEAGGAPDGADSGGD